MKSGSKFTGFSVEPGGTGVYTVFDVQKTHAAKKVANMMNICCLFFNWKTSESG